MPRRAICGIVLVFTTGLVVLIGLVGAIFLQVSLFSRTRGEIAAAVAATRLAAISGLEYAAVRLRAEPRSVTDIGVAQTAANRVDDWTDRSGQPSATSGQLRLNPSYSHGEPWSDTSGSNGRYDPGEPVLADLDGDGRFSAWSGRLRGGKGAFGNRFSLRITTASGTVCVNSGEVGALDGDHDLDGILNADDTAFSATSGPYRTDLDGGYGDFDNDLIPNGADADYVGALGNGIPDWRDPDFVGNTHLVNLLNNLGAVLGLAPDPSALFHPALPPAHPLNDGFVTTDLGRRVVAGRPRGGYLSVEDLRAVLTPTEFDAVSPYLSVEGRIVPVPFPLDAPDNKKNYLTKAVAAPESRYEFHALIDFNRAPWEVLAASLRHLCASGIYDDTNESSTITKTIPFIRLGGDEADGIARELVNRRPIHTWGAFLDALHQAALAGPLFQDDLFTVLDENSLPVNEAIDPILVRLKEDLILAQVAPAGYFGDPFTWRANSFEIPREPLPFIGLDAASTRRTAKDLLAGPLNTYPFDTAGVIAAKPSPNLVFHGIPARLTTEYDLSAPPRGSFQVVSEGSGAGEGAASAVAAGSLSLFRALEINGQQTFQIRATLERPVAPVSPWWFPGGGVRVEGPAPDAHGATTFPRFDLESYHYTGLGSTQPWMVLNDRYPRAMGGVQLSPRQLSHAELTNPGGVGPCFFALPFNRDRFDAPGVPEAGTWYATPNTRQWRENVGDPVLDQTTGQPRSADPLDLSGAPYDPHFFHEGLWCGPGGRRFGAVAFAWDGLTHSFPASAVDATGRPKNVTFSFWHAAGQSEPFATGFDTAGIRFEYRTASGFWKTHFVLLIHPDFQYLAGVMTTMAGQPVPVWWVSEPVLSRAGWHHLAVSIDPAGTSLTIYVDGVDVSPITIPAYPAPPANPPQFRLTLKGAIDDLRIFHPFLGTPEIEKLVREDRYDTSGTFTTARFHFNATDFPGGALLRGLAWDGFAPAQTGGSFSFVVRGYPASGPPATVTIPPWNGAGAASSFFDISGSLAAEIDIKIETTPAPLPLDPPGPAGGPANVLRDTPEIRSVTLFYGGRPCWSGIVLR